MGGSRGGVPLGCRSLNSRGLIKLRLSPPIFWRRHSEATSGPRRRRAPRDSNEAFPPPPPGGTVTCADRAMVCAECCGSVPERARETNSPQIARGGGRASHATPLQFSTASDQSSPPKAPSQIPAGRASRWLDSDRPAWAQLALWRPAPGSVRATRRWAGS